MTYLLRLVLPDRPGSLGAVATALGGTGVDIESLDVVERGPFGAVDDLFVTLPANGLADSLVTAARSVPGVEVESVRPFHRAHELTRDLDVVDALAAAPEDAFTRLAELAPDAFHASWALVLRVETETVPGTADAPTLVSTPVTVAASAAAPSERDLDASWLPLPSGQRFGPDEPWVPYSWFERGTELAAAPVGSPDIVILLGRTGGPQFRASEVVRLAHLAGLAASVVRAIGEPASI